MSEAPHGGCRRAQAKGQGHSPLPLELGVLLPYSLLPQMTLQADCHLASVLAEGESGGRAGESFLKPRRKEVPRPTSVGVSQPGAHLLLVSASAPHLRLRAVATVSKPCLLQVQTQRGEVLANAPQLAYGRSKRAPNS